MNVPLRTPRMDLEPLREMHAAEVWPQIDDDRMWTYFPALRPKTAEALHALYRKWEGGSPDPDQVWCNWACRDRASGSIVGTVQATIEPDEHAAYIAYGIYPAYQRMGYAREACVALLEHLRALGMRKAFAVVETRNDASNALAESLGFVKKSERDAEGLGLEPGAREYVYELLL